MATCTLATDASQADKLKADGNAKLKAAVEIHRGLSFNSVPLAVF